MKTEFGQDFLKVDALSIFHRSSFHFEIFATTCEHLKDVLSTFFLYVMNVNKTFSKRHFCGTLTVTL